MRRLKNALGYSGLLHAAFKEFAPDWWYLDERAVRVHPRGMGLELAKHLVERAAALCEDAGCDLLLVLQGDRTDDGASALVEHARRVSIEVLDLVDRFLARERAEPGLRRRYFRQHMTPEGNRWAAGEIAARIEELEARRAVDVEPVGLGPALR